jgi:tRNA (pseudouridine54-N1)-methyltransferase
MICFAAIGHTAVTDGNFSLNDMPGSGGRMDLLCRCVNAAFFLSHDLRRDVRCYLVLLGEPSPPKTILISGKDVRYLSPDERSAGALIKKSLSITCGTVFRESSPGVSVRRGGLGELLADHEFALLNESGRDIRTENALPNAFLLSDHHNLSEEERFLTRTCPRYSVGPRSLHADHTITVLLNERDRRQHAH